jgi:anhydro-N-acetylmuramic acid kinase
LIEVPLTNAKIWVLGLMSGTSADGVDAALVLTDGVGVEQHEMGQGRFVTLPYNAMFRRHLMACYGQQDAGLVGADVVRELTAYHVQACRQLLAGFEPPVSLIGFHGHTLHHDPANRITVQIGDAAYLAQQLGLPVVHDFRRQDVQAGGQGAPLVPIFHLALARGLDNAAAQSPLAVVNIGGVANLTYVDADRQVESMLAFDTGPGNGLLDDWVTRHTGKNFDENGQLAAAGTIQPTVLASLLSHPYFQAAPPKSLDRRAFDLAPLQQLSVEDGAATLTAFTVESIARSCQWLPSSPTKWLPTQWLPTQWLITGGGTQNGFLMQSLAQRLYPAPVRSVQQVGWNPDALEAQSFAFMAARHVYSLPISFPKTTGVASPSVGGQLVQP